MANIEELKQARLAKLEILKNNNIEAYPADTEQTHKIVDVINSFEDLLQEAREITIVGRLMSLRGQGAILFADLFDGTSAEKIQVVLKSDNEISYFSKDNPVELETSAFNLFVETVDIGDFIQFSGKPFITKSGQNSLEVSSWKMVAKSLLPIPDSFYGLKDEDERFRKRYLDILLNPEVRELMLKKSHFWSVTRSFMIEKGFIEVETPILELTTGGAEANPFKTHHKDFDLDVYLRISVGELWQKRLMSAGLPKTFEIGRVFRNEGSSNEHVQEFTNMEFYWAYADYKNGMELVKELYQALAQKVFGKTEFTTRGHTFDLAGNWDEIDYVEEIKRQAEIDVLSASESEMEDKLKELGVQFEGKNRERLTDSLWKYCRKNISGPAFLINHPKIVSPLSKEVKGSEDKTQRFQVILAGSEIGNGYSELNNPIEQEARFNQQEDLIKKGDEEAMMKDEEFVEMLEYGMPPACGFGFGERLFTFLSDKSIREVQMFPLMKPKE